jgi:hypothetical protein
MAAWQDRVEFGATTEPAREHGPDAALRGVPLHDHVRDHDQARAGEKRLFQGLKGRPPRFYIPCYSLDWVEAVNSSRPGILVGLQR